MLVLVAGLPGSGKSYFAIALCEKLGAKSISSDIVRDALSLRKQYDRQTKGKVYQEMEQLTRQYISGGASVVVDATFYQEKIRKIFIETADKNNTPWFIIEIKAAKETIKKRMEQKRHYSEADFDVYQKIKTLFEPIGHHHLILCSDRIDLDEMLESAIQYVELISED